ncbi:MAG TPA: hypothetical protein VF167_05510 [Longimicrobiaceae bacterium]
MGDIAKVRLVFADSGSFHTEFIEVERTTLEQYDRLIDLLREDPVVTRNNYVDLKRLVTATVLEAGE